MGVFSGDSSHTCPAAKNAAELNTVGVPTVGSVTFQHLILYICSGCLGLVGILCLFNIFMHLSHYSSPAQQRQVIRIVFTPVVFCLFAVCAVVNYSTAIYMSPIGDLYEVFAMAGIFLLFVEWVAPDPLTRDHYFANLENRKQNRGRFSRNKGYSVVPGGSSKWFKTKWIAVFLSIVVDIIIAITQEASQAAGTYCITSLKPYFAHLWVLIIGHVALLVAILAVLHSYGRLKQDPEFSRHQPLLKLVSLKLIVFTNFIQTFVFSILQGQGVLAGNNKITANDLQYGIPSLLVAVEQVIFAAFMLYSYRAAEYKSSSKQMGFLSAAFNAMNPLDLIQSMLKAFTYLVGGATSSKNGGDWRKPSQGKYSSGEETDLRPYTYSSDDQPQQCSPLHQPHPSNIRTQEPYVGVIPNYGGQGDDPVSDVRAGTVTENGRKQQYHGRQNPQGGGRRHHGPIGALISLGVSAARAAQNKGDSIGR